MVREDFTIENIIITLDPATAIIECDLKNIDIDLEASATGGIESYSYLWWNGSSDNPINLGMSPGNYNVTVIDGNGCEVDTAFTIATMTSDCVPNVFSPNGDGINDSWSLEDTFLYAESEVRIYGRFGRLIFQSVGYHKPWDGTNENGKDLPDGVYFYHLEIGNGFDPIQGTVTIIR
jgi:gliding motility-associated-like protein